MRDLPWDESRTTVIVEVSGLLSAVRVRIEKVPQFRVKRLLVEVLKEPGVGLRRCDEPPGSSGW